MITNLIQRTASAESGKCAASVWLCYHHTYRGFPGLLAVSCPLRRPIPDNSSLC